MNRLRKRLSGRFRSFLMEPNCGPLLLPLSAVLAQGPPEKKTSATPPNTMLVKARMLNPPKTGFSRKRKIVPAFGELVRFRCSIQHHPPLARWPIMVFRSSEVSSVPHRSRQAASKSTGSTRAPRVGFGAHAEHLPCAPLWPCASTTPPISRRTRSTMSRPPRLPP